MIYIREGSGYYLDSNGKMAWSKSKTADGHGGHAAEHHKEMQEIAESTVQRLVPQMINEYGARVWSNLISQMQGVLNRDITSIVRIGIEGCKDIFYDSKAQTYISNAIVDALMRELRNIKI